MRGLRRIPGLGAFQLGLICGVLVCGSLWGLGYLLTHPSPAPPYNVEVASAGGDVSRLDGRSLRVSDLGGPVMTQTCREDCDDIWFRMQAGGDNAVRVEVFDGAGHCLACEPPASTDIGFGDVVLRWTIAGRARLDGRVHGLVPGPGGALMPIEQDPRLKEVPRDPT
jgi:hypothetical protein